MKEQQQQIPAVSSAQLRAARALLDWSRLQCSQAVGISPETIKNIEQDRFVPTPITVEKIISAFSAHGVEFYSQHVVALKNNFAKRAEADKKEIPAEQIESAG